MGVRGYEQQRFYPFILIVLWKGVMNEQRWLLPCTYRVDVDAIETIVRLAASCGAALVAVSLIAIPNGHRSQEVLLEHLQPSTNFLEVVRSLALRFQVSLE